MDAITPLNVFLLIVAALEALLLGYSHAENRRLRKLILPFDRDRDGKPGGSRRG